ncbi:MAG: DUF4394 domain-containing protein [Pyrinomonadaceae bacterium]
MFTNFNVSVKRTAMALVGVVMAVSIIQVSQVSAQNRPPRVSRHSGIASPAAAEIIYATSGTEVTKFATDATGVLSSIPVSGMQPGEALVGIDLRPSTGQLYGVGNSSRLYIIDTSTGVATQVGAAGAFTLSGTSFATDFNPVADRLRVISNTGQNLRINPNDGSLAAADTTITPAGVTITGGAYDRNDRNPVSGTTLYAIDATNGVLTTVGSINGSPNSANGGVVGPAVGSLGLGTGMDPRIGFDISAAGGAAYATILTGGTDKLYSVNLATGAVTLVGTIGTGTTVYSGMTIASVPASAGELIYATSGSNIAQFTSGAPGILSSVPVTGMQGGETLIGFDLRPSTGQIYGVGTTGQLYIIDPNGGSASQIALASPFTPSGTAFGMDFNPVADRVRVISNLGQNIRLNPNDATLAATDAPISPPGVTITAIAYDRNDLNPATGTTLYGIDVTNGVLTTVGSINGSPNSPNGGVVGPAIGSLGLGTGMDPRIGLDISAATGTAYATILAGGVDRLYSVNLTTGAVTLLGTVGNGATVYRAMTVNAVPLATSAAQVTISGRVATAGGSGLRGVFVTLTDDSGAVRSTSTNAFGYYAFDRVDSGRSYILGASARRYTFRARLITVTDTLSELNMVADQ